MTRLRAMLILSMLWLAGCNTGYDQQALAYDQGLCQQMGAKTDTQMFQCVSQQQQYRTAEDDRRRAAAGAWGRQILANQQPRRMQTTTCNPLGNSVICNTF